MNQLLPNEAAIKLVNLKISSTASYAVEIILVFYL